jgi:cell division GTPase FtsZ
MSVKNSTITEEAQPVEDDISRETVPDGMDQEKLAQLKAQLLEKKKENMPPCIVEEKRKSLNLGIIGSGAAGSRIAEAFYKLGYNSVAINTASQDLKPIELPDSNKLLLEYSIGGAAKDVKIGHDAAQANKDGINSLIQDKLSDAQIYVLCLSLGGGSGAGSFDTMLEILSNTGKPIMAMVILPLSNDDVLTKNNSLNTLAKVSKAAQDKLISNIIVIDNVKLETIYSDVSHMDFFKVSNRAIVEPLDAFNHLTAMSSVESLDPLEWAKILTDGEGFSVYGEMSVENYQNETAIAEAVMNNLDGGLLASGFDLSHTKYAGALIVANKKVWEQIPQASINYAMSLIRETCQSADGVFRGVYEVDIPEDVVKVYSIFSGLALPVSRTEQLKKETEVELARSKERQKTRNVALELNTGTDTVVSKAQEVRDKIAKKSSKFGQNFAGGKDFRK